MKNSMIKIWFFFLRSMLLLLVYLVEFIAFMLIWFYANHRNILIMLVSHLTLTFFECKKKWLLTDLRLRAWNKIEILWEFIQPFTTYTRILRSTTNRHFISCCEGDDDFNFFLLFTPLSDLVGWLLDILRIWLMWVIAHLCLVEHDNQLRIANNNKTTKLASSFVPLKVKEKFSQELRIITNISHIFCLSKENQKKHSSRTWKKKW